MRSGDPTGLESRPRLAGAVTLVLRREALGQGISLLTLIHCDCTVSSGCIEDSCCNWLLPCRPGGASRLAERWTLQNLVSACCNLNEVVVLCSWRDISHGADRGDQVRSKDYDGWVQWMHRTCRRRLFAVLDYLMKLLAGLEKRNAASFECQSVSPTKVSTWVKPAKVALLCERQDPLHVEKY